MWISFNLVDLHKLICIEIENEKTWMDIIDLLKTKFDIPSDFAFYLDNKEINNLFQTIDYNIDYIQNSILVKFKYTEIFEEEEDSSDDEITFSLQHFMIECEINPKQSNGEETVGNDDKNEEINVNNSINSIVQSIQIKPPKQDNIRKRRKIRNSKSNTQEISFENSLINKNTKQQKTKQIPSITKPKRIRNSVSVTSTNRSQKIRTILPKRK